MAGEAQNEPGRNRTGQGPEVMFYNWREVLNRQPLSGSLKTGYSAAIEGYLRFCRLNYLSVTVAAG